jgi:hypothetical protein
LGVAEVKVLHPAFGGQALDVALENIATPTGSSLDKVSRAHAERLARDAFYEQVRHRRRPLEAR